jgi:euchromatic histone-lysine N-methyltransferase
LQPCICDCTKILDDSITKDIKSTESTEECRAIETVGGSRVGCCNKIQNSGSFWRASENIEPAQFCESHISRLKSHQCCGFCGEFCAHGIFLMCRPFTKAEPHLFHKSCYANSGTKNDPNGGKKCPHCHSTDRPLSVSLKLSMSRMPLSLLNSVSKMSFVKAKKTQMSDLILRRTNVVTYKMPNGKIISSEGLPEGLTDDTLEKVIEAVEDKDKLKHTTRNMYLPTKSGDTVKILQLLSLGYSPIAKFTEAENGTPLHVAAAEGHVLTAHVLVQAGAELDAIDDEQNTPLMLACIKGKANVVRYLLSAGADLTLRGDDGMTCLHLATQSGHLECVHVILGQNNLPRKFINLQDEGGWTPLVWACENKHEEVIQ